MSVPVQPAGVVQQLIQELARHGFSCFLSPPRLRRYVDGSVLGFYAPGQAIVVTLEVSAEPTASELRNANTTITFQPRANTDPFDLNLLLEKIQASKVLQVWSANGDFFDPDDPTSEQTISSYTISLIQRGSASPISIQTWVKAIGDICSLLQKLPLESQFEAFNAIGLCQWHAQYEKHLRDFFRQPYVLAALEDLAEVVKNKIFFKLPSSGKRKVILWPQR